MRSGSSGLYLTLPAIDVCVVYKVLEPRPLLNLPEQIDITAVWLDLDHGPEELRKKRSRVNIIHALDEGTIIGMEDEIIERRRAIEDAHQGKLSRKPGLPSPPRGSVTAGDGGNTTPVPFELICTLVED
jgi:hypothetical protein